jgi:DNA-binding NarL/FixJ family response regulator
MRKQKIIIVDDHKVFRKGLKMIIEDLESAEVVAEASTGEEFLDIIEQTEADIVFMDINMPNMNGFEATKIATAKKPKLSIIAMSANDDIASITEMLSSGAKGYLEKDVDYDEIHEAIKYLTQQKNYFSTNVFIKLTKNINKQIVKKKAELGYNNITKREQNVLELICKGFSNLEISEKLFISVRTVEKHKANLYIKTETENALNLALFAFKNDLVEL